MSLDGPPYTWRDRGNEGSVWARFELPKGFVSFRSSKQKPRVLTEEQRRAMVERLHPTTA